MTGLVFLSLCLSACGIKMISSGPHGTNEDVVGVRYYLPEDIVVVQAEKETRNIKKIKLYINKSIDPKEASYRDCLEIPDKAEPLPFNINSLDVSFKTVADKNKYYTIRASPEWYSSGTINIQRNNSGLLTGITLASQGQLDEIAVDTVKTVASIAGAVAGVPNLSSIDNILGKGEEAVGKTTCKDFINNKAKEKGLGDDFSSLNPVVQYAVFTDSFVEKNWKIVFDEKVQLQDLMNRQFQLLSDSSQAITEKNLENIETVIVFLDKRIKISRDRLKNKETELLTSVERVSRELGLGITTKTQDVLYAEPVSFWLKNRPSKKKEEIFDNIGHVIQLLPLAQVSESPVNAVVNTISTESSSGSSATDNDNEGVIYYRDKTPYLYEVRITKGGVDKLVTEGYVELFNSDTDPGSVKYEASTTGDRSLALTFGKNAGEGETVENTYALNSVNFTYTSSGQAVAKAAYNSVTGGIDEFGKAQDKVFAIKTKRRAEELAQLSHEITKKEKQKDLILKKLEYQGAAESSDLYLEKIKLDYEILTLKNRKDKLTAEFDLEAYVVTREQTLQNELLKTQLEVLKNQISIREQLKKLDELEEDKGK